MKTLLTLILLCLALLPQTPGRAAVSALVTVKQPVYMHTDVEGGIKIVDAQVVVIYGLAEGRFEAICWPHAPGAREPEKHVKDINLASLYKITVTADGETKGQLTVTIDASKAKVPEGYSFTIEQVVDAVTTCVKLMHPAKPESEMKFTVQTILPKEK